MVSAHKTQQNGNAVTRWITIACRASKLNVIQLLPHSKLRWDWLPRCRFVAFCVQKQCSDTNWIFRACAIAIVRLNYIF